MACVGCKDLIYQTTYKTSRQFRPSRISLAYYCLRTLTLHPNPYMASAACSTQPQLTHTFSSTLTAQLAA